MKGAIMQIRKRILGGEVLSVESFGSDVIPVLFDAGYLKHPDTPEDICMLQEMVRRQESEEEYACQ
jgi:hypothetical protein